MIMAVTGRVGSGKSYAADIIKSYFDVSIIDMDVIGHDLLNRADITAQCTDAFGEIILNTETRTIKRPILAEIVFGDKKELQKLNQIMHPEIKRSVISEIKVNTNDSIILGALIKEIDVQELCDSILVIDADDEKIKQFVGDKFFISKYQLSRKQFKLMATKYIINDYTNSFIEKCVKACTLLGLKEKA